jgi:thiosulfate dehydrogenase [quinone] large subunit
MSSRQISAGKGSVQFSDPPFLQSLMGNSRWAWLWLIVRLYVGYSWITSGIGKLSNPAWQSGAALKGFWTAAAAVPAAPAKPLIVFDWYRVFIQSLLDSGSYVWFAKLINAGEILIGIALIVGAFTGLAAFAGGFMNWNFMMAGTASINPVLFTLSILLFVAWKIAGYWGVDRWLLPALGTPWERGHIFGAADSPGNESGQPASAAR